MNLIERDLSLITDQKYAEGVKILGQVVRHLVKSGQFPERLEQEILTHRYFVYDPNRYLAMVQGEEITLTRIEGDLLSFMWHNPNQVLTREEIYRGVWQFENVNPQDRLIDVHLSRLRRKLGQTDERIIIRTIREIGYYFIDPDRLEEIQKEQKEKEKSEVVYGHRLLNFFSATGSIVSGDKRIDLNESENMLFSYLLENMDKSRSASEIADALIVRLGEGRIDSYIVMYVIGRLRKKLKKMGINPSEVIPPALGYKGYKVEGFFKISG